MYVTVHSDDFTIVRPMDFLRWLKSGLERAFENKAVFLGQNSEGCTEEIRVLNHVIRWTDSGIAYEPDPRHAEIAIRELALEAPRIKTASTPGSATTGLIEPSSPKNGIGRGRALATACSAAPPGLRAEPAVAVPPVVPHDVLPRSSNPQESP